MASLPFSWICCEQFHKNSENTNETFSLTLTRSEKVWQRFHLLNHNHHQVPGLKFRVLLDDIFLRLTCCLLLASLNYCKIYWGLCSPRSQDSSKFASILSLLDLDKSGHLDSEFDHRVRQDDKNQVWLTLSVTGIKVYLYLHILPESFFPAQYTQIGQWRSSYIIWSVWLRQDIWIILPDFSLKRKKITNTHSNSQEHSNLSLNRKSTRKTSLKTKGIK